MSKTKAIANDIAVNINTQRIIFKFLAVSFIILSIAYVYMIGSITFNIVARKSLENTERTLGSNISQLELEYLGDLDSINKTRALSLGFQDAKSSIFATRAINHVAIR